MSIINLMKKASKIQKILFNRKKHLENLISFKKAPHKKNYTPTLLELVLLDVNKKRVFQERYYEV